MKVIWRNNKSVEAGKDAVGLYGKQNELKKPSSHNSLTKAKGSHRTNKVKREQCLLESKPNIVDIEKSVASQAQAQGDTAVSAQECRVCSRKSELRSLDDCTALLDKCFGIKVQDPTMKICQHCADLICHTHTFKEMICAAFNTGDDGKSSSTVKEDVSFMSIGKSKSTLRRGSEEMFERRVNMKRKIGATQDKPPNNNKKTIVACVICKQRYAMMSMMGDFVCSRCKGKSSGDRKTRVSGSAKKEHLERCGDPSGRSRNHSLLTQLSKTHSEYDGQAQSHKQAKQDCPRCQKSFSAGLQLERHLRDAHATIPTYICHICYKDMRNAVNLEKHMKIHVRLETYECHICGRIFKDKSFLERHASFHAGRER